MQNQEKKCNIIIFSAPSGAGKSTVVHHLLNKYKFLQFSVSATSREPRKDEVNGKDYFFISNDEFREKITNKEFVEYEQVYEGTYYGTLKSEVERIWKNEGVVVFDVDVVGGANLKKLFGKQAVSVFIEPPSIKVLRERLISRGTDAPGSIEKRVAKAQAELSFKNKFDIVLVNDNLEKCLSEADSIIESHFVSKK